MCILSFTLFFSAFDLSAVALLNQKIGFAGECEVSDVLKVQYQIFRQTKDIVANIFDVIVRDVNMILTSAGAENTFINSAESFIVSEYCVYRNILKISFAQNASKINFAVKIFHVPLLFLGFIFLFFLKYLGLLRVFWDCGLLQKLKAYRV